MRKFRKRQKFQPRITPSNSERISNLPTSILQECCSYRSLRKLEELSKDESILIFYVLEDSSTEQALIPLRDEGRYFYTIIFKKEEK